MSHKDPERRKEYNLKYYHEHKEQANERRRKYRQEHREETREYERKYYWEHRQKLKEKVLKYRQEHKEELASKRRIQQLGSSRGVIRGLHKRPWLGFCELCGKAPRQLSYHHWDDNNPSKGIWVCNRCHMTIEGIDDKRTLRKFRRLKKQIEAQYDEGRTLGGEGQEAVQGTLFQGA
jgi:hypothetical protein